MTLTEFKQQVELLSENQHGCKLWKTTRTRDGYGQVRINGKRVRAHRASYRAFNGEIPKGFFVCHKCDCPPCVNPEHLWVGMHEENMADMARKGRAAGWKPTAPVLPLAKTIGDGDGPGVPFQTLYLGKLVQFQWVEQLGGWMASFDNKNILNPYTKSAFRHIRNCVHVTKFCIRHGYYPGLKPDPWRVRHGLPNTTL